jgi:3D (Asp-Asp-Asp) domain-containing protein
VPFESDYLAVADLEIDRQTIVEAGQYGILAERIRIRYEDGQEISRQSEDQWLAQEPVTQIIGYGTQIVMRSIQTGDGTVEYWRALQVYATSYKPSDTGSNITATGKILKKGIIGVNPRYIPYGTILYVEGYGYGEAADTGNIGPRWIDLGYTDEDFVGWHRNVTVYFVWPPPEKIVWIIP